MNRTCNHAHVVVRNVVDAVEVLCDRDVSFRYESLNGGDNEFVFQGDSQGEHLANEIGRRNAEDQHVCLVCDFVDVRAHQQAGSV